MPRLIGFTCAMVLCAASATASDNVRDSGCSGFYCWGSTASAQGFTGLLAAHADNERRRPGSKVPLASDMGSLPSAPTLENQSTPELR